MYVPPAIWSAVQLAAAVPGGDEAEVRARRQERLRSRARARLRRRPRVDQADGLRAEHVRRQRGRVAGLVPVRPGTAATPTPASTIARPTPISLAAQDPRTLERALRLPGIPER